MEAIGRQQVNGATPVKTEPAVPNPAQTAGQKRKRDNPTAKFYAVRTGRRPGVYATWDQCSAQVRGFPKPVFKSFSTRTEAENYVEGQDSGHPNAKVTKWYGVQAGRKPGVYTAWQDVLDQISGWKGAMQKAFKSKEEAEQYVTKASRSKTESSDGTRAETEDVEQPTSKKLKGKARKSNGGNQAEGTPIPLAEQGQYEPGDGPLLDDAEDDFDSNITLDPDTRRLRYKTRQERAEITYQAVRPVADAPIRIYTDGSSLSNGRADAVGGVGVYFGPGDRRNVSEPLAGSRQTNQRAELTAVVRALEMAPKDRRLIIVSDSKYAIDCATDWFQKWQSNGWQNAMRKPVENKDLVSKIVEMLEERLRLNKHRMVEAEDAKLPTTYEKRAHWNRGPGGVLFEWVKGHDKDKSNDAADSLAVEGARIAQALQQDVDLDD